MGIIISLLMAGIVIYLIFWILGMLPLPEPIMRVVELVVGVMVILWLFGLLTGKTLYF